MRVCTGGNTGALMIALALGGCVSTNPRPYAPLLQPPPVDQAAAQAAFNGCAARVASGARHFGGNATTVLAGSAGAVATGEVLGSAAVAGAYGVAGAGAFAATGVGLLILVPLGTLQLSRHRRASNEREVQAAMTGCMQEAGYHIASWTRLPAGQERGVGMQTPTRHVPPPNDVTAAR
jgi:hypothetical protein